jgi:integrase
MTWQEIDLAGKTWTLPAARAKNGRAHSVPLSDAALAILESLKSPNFGVFEPVSFSRMKGELDKLLPGVPAFTVHDLRRTFASGCARLGVRIEVVERTLNHSSGSFRGIVGIYQKYDFASEKRAALDLWAAHVAAFPAPPVALSKAA